ncbi:SCO family protein [Nitrosomonas sp.]|uniref:SCO family protein n=1 Tax=Nitrosomonas sp. TaxID=42353 RepID=UPI002617D5A6|nr:SCO family protein [Nitrosomonas sp.]
MNKREFIKHMAGASVGLATLGFSAVSLGANTPQNTSTAKPQNTAEQRRKDRFPNMTLLTHEGKEVRFYDDLVKDKAVFINFMYARCGDICPGMTANLKRLENEFGGRVGRDIFMYSITLEPEHDTLAMLKAYAENFDVGPGWKFLTGTKADIELLRRRLGFYYSDPERDRNKTEHIGVVKYGIEPLERWGTCPALANPKAMAQYFYWMEPNGARPVHEVEKVS